MQSINTEYVNPSYMSENSRSRPLLITILAILYFLGALSLIIGGILIIGLGEAFIQDLVNQNPDVDALKGLGTASGIVMLVFGLIVAGVAYGFYKGWSIMWYLSVIIVGLGLLFSIYNIVIGNFTVLLGALVQLVIIFYLFRPRVKGFFLG